MADPAPILPTTNTPAAPTPRTTGFVDPRRQRPNLVSLIWILLLFFFLNNGNNATDGAGPPSEAGRAKIVALLRTRERKRDGLAVWLGANMTYTNATIGAPGMGSNSTVELPIPFVPSYEARLEALVPSLHALLDRNSRTNYFPQNLTGFVKGRFDSGDWSYEKLGIEETFNTTTLTEVDKPEGGNAEAVVGGADSLAISSDPQKRQIPANESVALPSPKNFVNVTTTLNRTVTRGDFPWGKGGKITFNLREDLSSVVGAVEYGNNFKDGEGRLVWLREGAKETWELEGPVVYLKGDVTFISKNEAEYALDLEAVHFLSSGAIYGWATPSSFSSKVFSIPALPAFDPSYNSSSKMAAAGHCILKEVDRRITQDRNELSTNGFENQPAPQTPSQSPFPTGASPPPLCSFALSASLAPLPPSYPAHLYQEYYASLFHPTGASIPSPPDPQLSYLLYSNSCGLVLTGQGEVLESPRLWQRAGTFAVVMMVVQGLLLLMLVKQMETGRGLGNVVKVAYGSIALQAAMDSYFFILTFTIGVVTNTRASLPLLVPSFFAFIASLLFGMRYASDIRAAAPPPRPRPTIVVPPPPTREQLSAAAAERRAAAEGAGDTESAALLEPVQPTPSPAVSNPEPGEMKDSLFIGICMAVGIGALFIIITWGWIGLIVLVLYSYWLPQISLNVQRGAARLSLRHDYTIVSTLARLVLPLYIYGCPSNLLGVEPSRWSLALVMYSISQAAILLLQNSRLGARFFLPTTVLVALGIHDEDTWDYHPLIPPNVLDLESGKEQSEDCSICLEKIELGTDPKDDSPAARERRERQRWEVMVPPCGHRVHKACLEPWMAMRSLCPTCRARLPPL